MSSLPPSFLEELFRVSQLEGIISFAGGLPDATLIDCEGIARASGQVLSEEPMVALQYSTTDGYLPLREYIAERYKSRFNIPPEPDNIQIVNGSQQCLDLVAKIFLDTGDTVAIEAPGYLGAIEAFSLYEPLFCPIKVTNEGPSIAELEKCVCEVKPKFFYGIPNSQNPSGITWSNEKRLAVAQIMEGTETVFFEDDAFGELFFDQVPRVPVKKYLPSQTVLSGSFSKIIAPGLRIGWIYAPHEIIKQFNIVKQSADLHSNFLAQKILHRYLVDNSLDEHLKKISEIYGKRCSYMCDLIDDMLPQCIHTKPEGGMFLIVNLPDSISAMDLFKKGINEGVAVLPGSPFFVNGGGDDFIRLNFSNTSFESIYEGMERLKKAFDR